MSPSNQKIDKDEFFASQDRYIHGEDSFYDMNEEDGEILKVPRAVKETSPAGKRSQESNHKAITKKPKSEENMKLFSSMKFCRYQVA